LCDLAVLERRAYSAPEET